MGTGDLSGDQDATLTTHRPNGRLTHEGFLSAASGVWRASHAPHVGQTQLKKVLAFWPGLFCIRTHFARLSFLLCVLLPAGALAATLGIPAPYTTLSGIGVISGWKCEAGDLTVRFNGGDPFPLVYGSRRTDVLDAGACDHADVGFVAIWNWSELGDGLHTAVVYDDGVEFDRSRFYVVTAGEGFLQGAAGQCIVSDFPAPREVARFVWNQPTQHMELAEIGGAELLPVIEECEETPCPTCEVCRTCPTCPGTDPPTDPMAKFSGAWQLYSNLTANCQPPTEGRGELWIELSGEVSGWFKQDQDIRYAPSVFKNNIRYEIEGYINAQGYIELTFHYWLIPRSAGERRQEGLSFTGYFQDGQYGSGSYAYTVGCQGTWRARRQ